MLIMMGLKTGVVCTVYTVVVMGDRATHKVGMYSVDALAMEYVHGIDVSCMYICTLCVPTYLLFICWCRCSGGQAVAVKFIGRYRMGKGLQVVRQGVPEMDGVRQGGGSG